MNALVCGGRDYADRRRMFSELDSLHKARPITLLITGAARGADWLALEWAAAREVNFRGYPAKWKMLSKRAGFARNLQMLKDEVPDVVVAFPGGPGTAHMVAIAREYDVEVIEVAP